VDVPREEPRKRCINPHNSGIVKWVGSKMPGKRYSAERATANREPLLHEIIEQSKRDATPMHAKPSTFRLFKVHSDDRFPQKQPATGG
jgi:hypothetical protein